MSEFRRVFFSRRNIFYLLTSVLISVIFFIFDCTDSKEITLTGDALSDYINGYPKFLQSIQDNANNSETIAALSGGFSAENIKKTASDYAKLSDVKPIIGNNKGFVLLSGYETGDILILTVTLLIAADFNEERKKGLTALIRSTKNGRRLLSVQRTAIIVAAALTASIIINAACFLTAELMCGSMNVLRPIQSVPEFSLCPFRITLLDYLIFSVLMKTAAAAVCGSFLYLITSVMDPVIGFAICGAAFTAEFILYAAILPTSSLAGIKFCNAAAVLRSDVFFREYCNLNIFGNAIGFLQYAVFTVTAALVLLSAMCCIFTSAGDEKIAVSGRMSDKIRSFISRRSPCPTLPVWEIKKVFIDQKGALLLAVIVYISASSALQYRYAIPAYSQYEEMYYDKFSGVVTEEMREKMISEYDKIYARQTELYEEYLAELEANDHQLNDELIISYNRQLDMSEQLAALDEFIGKADRALNYSERTGIETELIKPKIYELLLINDTSSTNKNAMYIILAMVGIFAGICANENRCNMDHILRSSAKGRGRLTAIKLGIIGAAAIFITAAVYAPQVMLIGAEGYNDITAAAQSLEFLRFVPFETSILGYLVMIFAVRMLAAFAVGASVMLISRCCKSAVTAVSVSTAVIIIPSALSGTGLLPVLSFADIVGFTLIG